MRAGGNPIWVGSLWHQSRDAFVAVYGTDAEEVESRLFERADEEFRRMIDDFSCAEHPDSCECEPENDILMGKIFSETWGFTAEQLSSEELAELLENGLVVV